MRTTKNNLTSIALLAAALAPHKEPLQHGDRVVWKDGLKNKKYPDYGQVCIVTRSHSTPVTDSDKDSGGCYFNEPLDIALGRLDSDGELVEYHFDSRRFRLATDEEIERAMK